MMAKAKTHFCDVINLHPGIEKNCKACKIFSPLFLVWVKYGAEEILQILARNAVTQAQRIKVFAK